MKGLRNIEQTTFFLISAVWPLTMWPQNQYGSSTLQEHLLYHVRQLSSTGVQRYCDDQVSIVAHGPQCSPDLQFYWSEQNYRYISNLVQRVYHSFSCYICWFYKKKIIMVIELHWTFLCQYLLLYKTLPLSYFSLF